MPFIKSNEKDELRVEVRKLKTYPKEYFSELFNEYCMKANSSNRTGLPEIDKVWLPIIKNSKFPVLKKLLMGVLSMFHSTASVEGEISITRNVLGDRSHRIKDDTLEAKKIIKSAVIEAPADCCYDFDVADEIYYEDWNSSYREKKSHKESVLFSTGRQ